MFYEARMPQDKTRGVLVSCHRVSQKSQSGGFAISCFSKSRIQRCEGDATKLRNNDSFYTFIGCFFIKSLLLLYINFLRIKSVGDIGGF